MESKNETKSSCNKREAPNKDETRLKIIEVATGIISSFIALMAVIVSLFSLRQANRLMDYQISQERLPKVIALNGEITNAFEITNDGEIYNYDSINNLSIPIFNIGVGAAKNCEIKWEDSSIKSACLTAKDILNKYVSFCEYEYSKDNLPSLTIYEYLFRYEKTELDAILFYDKALSEIKDIGFSSSDLKIAYILPITNQSSNISINIPTPIAIFLLEYAKHGIEDPIGLYLDSSYQDINGKSFTDRVYVEFIINNTILEESDSPYDNDTLRYTYNIKVSETQN